jgi:hypothetical protein
MEGAANTPDTKLYPKHWFCVVATGINPMQDIILTRVTIYQWFAAITTKPA